MLFILQSIEKQSGYTFYYDTLQFDTAKLTVTLAPQPLPNALKSVLDLNDLLFSIDAQNRVYVTKGRRVQTELTILQPAEADSDSITARITHTPDGNTSQQNTSAIDNKLYVIGDRSRPQNDGPIRLVGYVRDAVTGEPVVGASIIVENTGQGAAADQYGYYALTLQRGQYALNIQSIGMRDTRRRIALYSDGNFDIIMPQEVITLKNVTISSQKASNVRTMLMGVQKLDIKTIKQIPVVFGEADILKVFEMLPGVKTVGEASTGLNVRGGAADQNLILFNDATIFNPSHFFGLFSAFNPEVVKDAELYKSSIPARFGGRLSSVLDINSREGNKKEITGSAGIGMLTARANIEGPLIKDKASFIVGGRSTYANWLLNRLPEEYKNSRASFYDINANLHYEIDNRNVLYFTAYKSHDKFNLNSDTTFSYGNQNLSLKYKHIFSNKLNGTFTTGIDHYDYRVTSDYNPVNAFQLDFSIRQLYAKAHFNYYLNAKHTLEFGVNTLHYSLQPGRRNPFGDSSLIIPQTIEKEQAMESALYLSDRYNISRALSLEAGIRYSLYNYLGAQSVNQYADGVPRTENTVTSTTFYNSWQNIQTYGGPEFRAGIRYAFNDSLSLKASINTQRQYIHTLSNTMAIAPTDIRKLSDPNIKPQYGEQVSVGIYKNFKANTVELSVEGYYKRINNVLDFKSGAQLIMNPNPEVDVINTTGKAYGIEFMLKKLTGKLNGWIGYSYSRTFLQQDDPLAGEIINDGAYYPANYDMPHDATVVGNYRFSHRFSISVNATYNTGRPITPPVGTFYYAGAVRTLYADRNSLRIPDYFRTDFSMNIDGNHKVNQKLHSNWSIGMYNVTGRKNAYSVYFVTENGIVNGYKLAIFGSMIPYVNLNIRF